MEILFDCYCYQVVLEVNDLLFRPEAVTSYWLPNGFLKKAFNSFVLSLFAILYTLMIILYN
jgi:hypothetical protein